MSATAPRTISNAPDVRQLGVAVGALILAVALVVAVTVSRQNVASSTTPLAAPAPAVHDQGWEATAPLAPSTHDQGWATTGASAPGLVIRGTNGGGIQYTGIPSSAPDSTPISGGRGTRFAR